MRRAGGLVEALAQSPDSLQFYLDLMEITATAARATEN